MDRTPPARSDQGRETYVPTRPHANRLTRGYDLDELRRMVRDGTFLGVVDPYCGRGVTGILDSQLGSGPLLSLSAYGLQRGMIFEKWA